MTVRDEVLVHHRFGPFLLVPSRRSLTRDGAPVVLSTRAFDLLLVLLQRRDEVVSKDELRRDVWRGMSVDDNNLAVQISVLRRALGEQPGGAPYILTVPGRGYQFVASLVGDTSPEDTVSPAPETPPAVPATTPRPDARLRRAWAIAAGLGILALAAWVALPHPRPGLVAPRLSIAVLPFRNLSADPDQDYLADAISDDLTTDLSHMPGSTVIARTSADTFRSRNATADAVGRALNVRYLLEGSLRAEGGSLHINAQLIDASTGGHLWARAFDVARDKLGVARTGIVRNIASALDVTLAEVEGARSLHDRPDNPDAVDFYLRARSVLGRGSTLESLTEAQDLLEKAAAAAPGFPDALAALGNVLARKIVEFDDPEEVADNSRAREAVARALAIAPQNAAAITARGYLARVDRHYGEARASFQMALSLDPGDMQARSGLAACSRLLGRMQEAIDELKALLLLDPASPTTAKREVGIGVSYLMLGNAQEAIAWLDRAGTGTQDIALQGPMLGWQEWRVISLIAATMLAGEQEAARTRYAAYARARPNRTVWRLASYDTRFQKAVPGHAAYRTALAQAGMPAFAREDEDAGIPPAATPHVGGEFDPTPLAIPGAARITTRDLHALLASTPPPLILDVGRGSGVIPNAVWAWQQGLASPDGLIAKAAGAAMRAKRAIVVMGDGTAGWASYNASLKLVAQGFHSVLWYRGGDEAWAEAGYPAEDRRTD